MQGFTVIDLVILIVYLAAVLFAGLHFAKKEMKGKEYFKTHCPWQGILMQGRGSCGLPSLVCCWLFR